MSIYGIGAYYDVDKSKDFIKSKTIGCGWNVKDAPEIHQFIKSLKVGDIVYIKAFSPSSSDLIIKAIGVIVDDDIVNSSIMECGRNVEWFNEEELRIKKPSEKNNVRMNTIYEEFNPQVQKKIINKIIK